MAVTLGAKLSVGFQGVVAATLVVARWADVASRVLEVGVGSPGSHTLLMDGGVGLAR